MSCDVMGGRAKIGLKKAKKQKVELTRRRRGVDRWNMTTYKEKSDSSGDDDDDVHAPLHTHQTHILTHGRRKHATAVTNPRLEWSLPHRNFTVVTLSWVCVCAV